MCSIGEVVVIKIHTRPHTAAQSHTELQLPSITSTPQMQRVRFSSGSMPTSFPVLAVSGACHDFDPAVMRWVAGWLTDCSSASASTSRPAAASTHYAHYAERGPHDTWSPVGCPGSELRGITYANEVRMAGDGDWSVPGMGRWRRRCCASVRTRAGREGEDSSGQRTLLDGNES